MVTIAIIATIGRQRLGTQGRGLLCLCTRRLLFAKFALPCPFASSFTSWMTLCVHVSVCVLTAVQSICRLSSHLQVAGFVHIISWCIFSSLALRLFYVRGSLQIERWASVMNEWMYERANKWIQVPLLVPCPYSLLTFLYCINCSRKERESTFHPLIHGKL